MDYFEHNARRGARPGAIARKKVEPDPIEFEEVRPAEAIQVIEHDAVSTTVIEKMRGVFRVLGKRG